MAQEIYHRSNWGVASNEWGSTYLNADLTNELYKRAGYYENSWATDKILNKIGTKPSIIMTPNAYGNGVLNSVKPKGGENLLTYSEDFSQSVWGKNDVLIESGYTAPDGTNTAYKVTENGSSAHLVGFNGQNTNKRKSIWARTVSGTGTVQLLNQHPDTSNIFNLTTQWQRFDLAHAAFNAFYAVDFRGASTTLSEVVLWGAQLERGSKATTYIPTNGTAIKNADFDFTRGSSATRVNEKGLIQTDDTDLPRIDYTDGEGSLLLEPSRTNRLLQSNQFDTTWTLSSSITLTSGQSGVFGSNDAWLLKRNGTGSRYIQQSLSLSSAQYSYSVYLKAESTNWVFLWSYDGSASVNAYFDLENGVVGQIGGAALDNTNIESVGNGWYRCTLIYTHAPSLIRIYPANSNGDTINGADNGIYIQYAQLEQGSYPTSYIPTNGTTVTRLADEANNAGNSDLINSTEGVLYAEIAALADDGTFRVISLDSGDNTNVVKLGYRNTSNAIYYEVRSGDVSQAFQIYTTTDVKQFHKVAVLYQQNNFKLFVNGVNVLYDTSGITPVGLNNISFDVNNYNNFYGNVKCLAVFKEALSDEELHKLTSL